MITQAKYQGSVIKTSEDMSQIKVFVTDRRTGGWTNEFLCSPAFAKAQGTTRHSHCLNYAIPKYIIGKVSSDVHLYHRLLNSME